MRPVRAPAAAAVALVCAGAAAAHTSGPHTGLVGTVSGTHPVVPGLIVQLIGAHERISVRNFTQNEVVLFGPGGDVVERLKPGEGRAWVDPRVRYTGPPPTKEGLVKSWQIPGETGGRRFVIEGFLGYRPPPGSKDGGVLPTWAIAALVAAGLVVVAAALALPLMRRKGEDERREGTTGS